MHANLNGDFVRGMNYTHLPEIIQQGVKLHRSIDDFIDRHPKVLELKRAFQGDLPKVSGIAIDLIFDQLLAKNWNQYHPIELNTFLSNFYQSALPYQDYLHPNYLFLMDKIIEYRWINQYPLLSGLDAAASGLSRRISFPNELSKTTAVYLKFEDQTNRVFEDFIKDVMNHFEVVPPSI